MMSKKILVWLSWWVDSAVSAALLLEQWYEVVGGFMKNYVSEKGNCTTYKDAQEAIKVAKHLWIEIRSYDLQQEYKEKIIDYIFAGYEKGITPNPDVLCNSLIKFDVFMKKALEEGFDGIATGHYARIEEEKGEFHLLRGIDRIKDQSYFLAGLDQNQLSKSFFPVWVYEKTEVRALAKKFNLPNAERKDSQGLCFIGNVPIREFLKQRFPQKNGDILYLNPETWATKKVGTHEGAYFYTIGQRHGLSLNFKAYIYRIDIEKNLVYVTDKDAEQLQTRSLIARNWHWIFESAKEKKEKSLTGKIRYRQNPPVACRLTEFEEDKVKVDFEEPQWAVTPGQVFVAYDGEICLGSGIIE